MRGCQEISWSEAGSPQRATRVQQIPEHATKQGHDRPRNKKADPGFPRSAAICCDFHAALNLRVEGSIPSRLTTPFKALSVF
jgi:hypothetical protein